METDTVELNPTECPICHDTYKVPKILPCAHLLCRDCLVTWIKMNSNAQCLVCCSAIRNILDTEPTSCEEYADSLTTDHSMTSVIESANMLNQQRVCYVHTDLTAAFICLQCGVMLCAICEEVHRKLPMSASHRIEDLANLTLENLANSRQVPCISHSDKPTELFCPTHNIPICNLCASTKHRACPEMIDLQDKKQLKQTLSELKIELTAAEFEFSKIVTKYEEQLAVSDATTNRLNSEIDQVCDRIQSSLEAYRQRLKRRVLEEVTVVQESARAGKALIGHKSGRVTSHLQLLKRVEQYAPDTYLFLMTKMLSSRVKELELDASLPAVVNPVSTLSLVVDENALKRVEQTFCTILHLKTIPLFPGAEQNVWRFHMNHGKNVVLSNNGHTAESSSTRFGVVISEEAMVVNRLYEVKVEEIREERMREIMVGVILENTTELHDLKYACGMDTTIAILNNGAIVFKNWNVNTSCPALLTVKVGSHLGVLIDSAYCLHIYIDGKDQGVVVRYVRQPCHAMFDLYSCLRKENVWQFNSKHGKNIKLYHEGQTAVSIGQCFGTVMSKNPMAINKLYEVKVEKTREGFTGKGILVGVVSGVSKEIEHMPYANKLDKAVAVMSSYSFLYTEKRNEIRCPLLENVKVDNRIGVLVDGAHCLHLYVDGKDQRVIVPDIRLPCYAMFDLYVYLQKITTLPVTDVN